VRLTMPVTSRASVALIGGAAAASRSAQARMRSVSSLSWFATGCSQRDSTPQRALLCAASHLGRYAALPTQIKGLPWSLTTAVASLTLRCGAVPLAYLAPALSARTGTRRGVGVSPRRRYPPCGSREPWEAPCVHWRRPALRRERSLPSPAGCRIPARHCADSAERRQLKLSHTTIVALSSGENLGLTHLRIRWCPGPTPPTSSGPC